MLSNGHKLVSTVWPTFEVFWYVDITEIKQVAFLLTSARIDVAA